MIKLWRTYQWYLFCMKYAVWLMMNGFSFALAMEMMQLAMQAGNGGNHD